MVLARWTSAPSLYDPLAAWEDLSQDPTWVYPDPQVRRPHSLTPLTVAAGGSVVDPAQGLANYDLRLYVQPASPITWPCTMTTHLPVTVADESVLLYVLPEVQLRATLRESAVLVVVSLPDGSSLPPLLHV